METTIQCVCQRPAACCACVSNIWPKNGHSSYLGLSVFLKSSGPLTRLSGPLSFLDCTCACPGHNVTCPGHNVTFPGHNVTCPGHTLVNLTGFHARLLLPPPLFPPSGRGFARLFWGRVRFTAFGVWLFGGGAWLNRVGAMMTGGGTRTTKGVVMIIGHGQ